MLTVFEHVLGQSWRVIFQLWAGPIRKKDEAIERYERCSEDIGPVGPPRPRPYRAGGLTFTGADTDPVYFESYVLRVGPWTLSADSDYGIEGQTPDTTHAIVNTENSRFVGITLVGSLVNQRIQWFCHAKPIVSFGALPSFNCGSR